MKVAIDCKSLLLQKALEKFLKNNLTSKNSADFIIVDYEYNFNKPLMVIGKDIEKPFSRSSLFIAIENFENRYKTIKDLNEDLKNDKENLNLDQKIELLTKKFVKDIVNEVKKHYEQ